MIGVAAATTILLLFLWFAREVLLLTFAGVLLAIFFRALANWVCEKTGLPAKWAVGGVILSLLVVLALAFLVRGEAIAEQTRELREQLPRATQQVREFLERHAWGRKVIQELPSTDEIIPTPETAIQQATDVLSRTARWLANALIIFFFGLLLAVQPGPYLNGLVRLFPLDKRERATEIIDELGFTLKRWLVGQVVAMLAVGTLVWIGLRALDVPLAFTLALIAGLLEFIPFIGPIIASIPAILLALLDSPQKALWVALLYTAIQQAESYIITPLVQWKAVWLPPALTIFAQITLVLFAGLLGVALAAPLLAAVMVLVQMLYIGDVLGDHMRKKQIRERE